MSWTRRDVMLGAVSLAGSAWLPQNAHARGGALVEIGGTAFGTTWQVLLPAEADAARIRHEIAGLLVSLDAVMSPFQEDSELTRLNRSHGPAILSKPLADVVGEGLRIARLTNGAFDPTIGPAVARFGFGPIVRSAAGTMPGNYRGLAMQGRRLAKRDSALTFDPCGIGKGYALDRIGALIAASGVAAFFAEFGGEVLVRGRHPTGRPWHVGIEDPAHGDSGPPRHVVGMTGGAIATSGDRVNAYVVGGRRYSHIIDPHTAAPVNNGVAAVSVMARTAMRADALATALMVLGPARGLALAKREALPVLFVLRDGDVYRNLATASFRAMKTA